MLELMMGQARGSLTLKDVRRKADAVFRHLGLDNKNDELDYPNFCKGMKYLGTYLFFCNLFVSCHMLSLRVITGIIPGIPTESLRNP